MKRLLVKCSVVAALLASSMVAQAKTTLTVYTALEADQIKAYQKAFETQYPDIALEFVRDSTGIITTKLLAEKNNPRADVIWGLAGTSIGVMAAEGMLIPYAPKNLANIAKNMRDSAAVPSWVGMNGYAAAICVNKPEMEKHGLPIPSSWQDLTKPIYQGKIVMPNPKSSGTGFLDVSAWLQMMGEKNGWAFMDALHKNIGTYTHSGSKPCTLAASGEYPIGISFDYRALKLQKEGAPLAVVFPKEGLGWEIEATAIMKGTKNLEAAKKLADFSASEQANRLYDKNFSILAYPAVQTKNPSLPANFYSLLIKNDFAWAAKNRERIINEWTKRYDMKSEKK